MSANEDFQLDGIPVFVHPLGRGESPYARVSISFRVGSYDEVLAYSGITRLAHNIICASLPWELREFVSSRNGGIFTMFNIAAPVERFHECLRALAAAIRSPQWDATQRIQRLLVADPNPDAVFPADVMLRDRYGSVGPGTTVLQPMALAAVSQDALHTWVSEHFCRENASIVSTESAIEPGSFVLASGQSRALLFHAPQPLNLPAYFNNGEDGVGFQLVLPTSATSDLAVAIIAELIHRRVTQLEQLSPRVAFGSNLLDSSNRSFTGSMPISTENVVPAVNAIRQTLYDIAEEHVGPEVIDKARASMEEQLREQIRSGEDTFSRSHVAIFSVAPSAEPTLAALPTITKEHICAVVREALSTLLLYVPEGIVLDNVSAGQFVEPAPISGAKYRKVGLRIFRNSRTLVTASEEGITYRATDNEVTVRFADTTALMDNGVSLHLVDRNGSYIKLFPSMYRKGDELAGLIRKSIDPVLVVPLEATDDDEAVQKRALQHARDLSGWRAWVSVAALAYLFVLGFAVAYVITKFAAMNLANFSIVAVVVGFFSWAFRPSNRRFRIASALRKSAEVVQNLTPGLILTYLVDTYLVLTAFDELSAEPVNFWGLGLLAVAVLPIATAVFAYSTSKETGRKRILHTFRYIYFGNAVQLVIGVVAILVMTALH